MGEKFDEVQDELDGLPDVVSLPKRLRTPEFGKSTFMPSFKSLAQRLDLRK
jgi:hypothetical protein